MKTRLRGRGRERELQTNRAAQFWMQNILHAPFNYRIEYILHNKSANVEHLFWVMFIPGIHIHLMSWARTSINTHRRICVRGVSCLKILIYLETISSSKLRLIDLLVRWAASLDAFAHSIRKYELCYMTV